MNGLTKAGLLITMFCGLIATAKSETVTIDLNKNKAISPLLMDVFFEDLNYAGDDGRDDVILRSPHRDEKTVRARYLKLTVLTGEPGLWEFRGY